MYIEYQYKCVARWSQLYPAAATASLLGGIALLSSEEEGAWLLLSAGVGLLVMLDEDCTVVLLESIARTSGRHLDSILVAGPLESSSVSKCVSWRNLAKRSTQRKLTLPP